MTQEQCVPLAERLGLMLHEGFMTDCAFLLTDSAGKEQRLACHRVLLSFSSPVFRAMLGDTWHGEGAGDIRIPDVIFEHFQLMIKCLYTDSLTLENPDTAVQVLQAAHKYMLPLVMDKCTRFIQQNITSSTAISVFETARFLGLETLEASALKFLQENTRDVLADPSFAGCSAATLKAILEVNTLSLSSELDLVKACVRWGEARIVEQTQVSAENNVAEPTQGTEREAKSPAIRVGVTSETQTNLTERSIDKSLTSADSKEEQAREEFSKQMNLKLTSVRFREVLGDLVFLLRLRTLSCAQFISHVVPSPLMTARQNLTWLQFLNDEEKFKIPPKFSDKTREFLPKGRSKLQYEENNCKLSGTERLINAVRAGNVTIVKYLLTARVDPNTVNRDQSCPLHEAVIHGDIKVVELLLDHGANVNTQGYRYQRTALYIASENGNIEIVKYLLARGAGCENEDREGKRAIHFAAMYGKIQVLKELISAGCDVNARSSRDGTTALHFAAHFRNTKAAKLLLENGADVNMKNSKDQTPMFLAFDNDETDCSQLIAAYVQNKEMIKA